MRLPGAGPEQGIDEPKNEMNTKDATGRIAHHLEEAFASALNSLVGKPCSFTLNPGGDAPEIEEPLVWQQSFSAIPRPALWIAAGRALWKASAHEILGAVGADAITDDDCRATWHEIASQTVSGLAARITEDIGSEITATAGDQIPVEPAGITWIPGTVRIEEQTWPVNIAWSPELITLGGAQPPSRPDPNARRRDNAVSKTFDLLLDIALPVSVSFGKTCLQVREVLKLNTGSIVELDRFVSEPVDVVVNDCVIARGEVVVVDGNYGVRITQLATREERLRSGMAEARAGGRGR